jgi:hypothetical protein
MGSSNYGPRAEDRQVTLSTQKHGCYCLIQSCTIFLHACIALCKCADWLTNLHPPPYRSRQIIYLSHSESVPLPLHKSSSPCLTSYMPGRAVASLCTSRQIICLSHSESVPLPLRNSRGHSLISYMPGRAVASFARVQAELHTSSHTVRCARLVHLWSN